MSLSAIPVSDIAVFGSATPAPGTEGAKPTSRARRLGELGES